MLPDDWSAFAFLLSVALARDAEHVFVLLDDANTTGFVLLVLLRRLLLPAAFEVDWATLRAPPTPLVLGPAADAESDASMGPGPSVNTDSSLVSIVPGPTGA